MAYIKISESAKRVIVLIIASAMAVIAITALTASVGDWLTITINSLMLAGCVFGAFGAYKMRQDYLGYFLLVVFAMIVLQAVALILSVAAHNKLHDFLWNIINLALLVILAGFVTDLRSDVGGYTSIV